MIDLGSGTASYDGLDIDASDSTVQGLAINGFNNGIQIEPGSTGDLIQGNFIGTDVTGTYQQSNNQGILVNDTSGDTIGGTTPAARNVVSGNTGQDIFLAYGASGNLVEGNFVGLTASGTSTLYNAGNGVIAYYSRRQHGRRDRRRGRQRDRRDRQRRHPVRRVERLRGGGQLHRHRPDRDHRPGQRPGRRHPLRLVGRHDRRHDARVRQPHLGQRRPASSSPTTPTATRSRGTSSAPTPRGRTPCPTPGRAWRSSSAPRTTRSAARPPARATPSPSTPAPASSSAATRATQADRQRHPVELDLRQRRPGHRPGRRRRHPEHAGRAAQRPQRPPELTPSCPRPPHSTATPTSSGRSTAPPARPSPCNSSPTPPPTPAATARARALIGTTTVTTDANGNASFIASFPGAIPAGQAVSATATDPNGNTSEFAQDVTVVRDHLARGGGQRHLQHRREQHAHRAGPGRPGQRLRPDRRDPVGGPGHAAPRMAPCRSSRTGHSPTRPTPASSAPIPSPTTTPTGRISRTWPRSRST